MTDRRYTRPEFERELDALLYATGSDGGAHRRLLSWYDEVMYDLGQVGALREALRKVTAEKVEAEVLAEEAEQRVLHLERQLAAKRVEGEMEEEGE